MRTTFTFAVTLAMLGFVGCATPSPEPSAPDAADGHADPSMPAPSPITSDTPATAATPAPAATASAATASAAPAATGAAPPSSSAAPEKSPVSASGPESVEECKAMLDTAAAADTDATITVGPEGGKSDRHKGIVATLSSQRGAFRCCYDFWSKKNPNKDAEIRLAISLDEKGATTAVEIERPPSDALSAEADSCIVDIAEAITFPASPSGKLTTFKYDLGFKHHKAADR